MVQMTKSALEQQFQQAVQFHKRGLLPQAESLYKNIILQAPNHFPTLKNYAVLSMQANNYNVAENLLSKVVNTSHNDEQSSINYAVCKRSLGKKSEAITILGEVLKLNPNSQSACAMLSQIELPGKFYFDYLKDFHQWLAPETYIEVGVFTGQSLALASDKTQSIGIDPEPKIAQTLNSNTKVYSLTSDDFFAQHNVEELFNNRRIDFAFIDGLHVFEAALKDFFNIEKHAKKESVIVFHDCIPLNKLTSERERVTGFWSGDVWKIVPILKKYRPDLNIFTIPSPPTGLCVVTNLDPESTILSDNYEKILADYLPKNYNYIAEKKSEMLSVAEHDWAAIQKRIRP